MKFSLNGQKDNFSLLREARTVANLTNTYYGGSRLQAFYRAIQFTRETRMRPLEALEYGVFAPEGRNASDYLSKRTCSGLQRKLNPPDWFWVTEDKGIFNSLCEARSIPVPKCHALLFRDSAGVSGGRPVPPTRAGWVETIARLDLDKVVIKPCRHSYGRGLFVPEVQGTAIKAAGQSFDGIEQMVAHMFDLPELTSWIIQERIRSHETMDSFSGTEHLQTMRIYTHVDADGHIHVIDSFLKVIGADSAIDNFQHGTLGNFIAPIHVSTGRLEPAITRSAERRWSRLETHPRTGERFEDFTIPLWEDAKALVVRSAEYFKPIRSLGWDVAVTPQGPVVIEANIRWDPPNWNPETVRNVRKVLEEPDYVAGEGPR